MVIGPAKAGPICLCEADPLDGGPEPPHRGKAEHTVAGSAELIPEVCRDFSSRKHVLPRLDRFIAGRGEVGFGRIVQIHIPAPADQARAFRHQRHRR